MVLARAAREHELPASISSRSHLRAGRRARAVRRRAAERVLRQPVRRSHAAVASRRAASWSRRARTSRSTAAIRGRSSARCAKARRSATDALQLTGSRSAQGRCAGRLASELPGRRLQHEHSMVGRSRDARCVSSRMASVPAGFFGCIRRGSSGGHIGRRSRAGGERARAAGSEAVATSLRSPTVAASDRDATLFSAAPLLACATRRGRAARAFGPRRHEERDEQGALLSFFHGDGASRRAARQGAARAAAARSPAAHAAVTSRPTKRR